MLCFCLVFLFFAKASIPTCKSCYFFQWRVDGTFTRLSAYNGSSFVDSGYNLAGEWARSGEFFEIRIPLSELGNPTTSLQMHISMINEVDGAESTFGGMPSSSFTTGHDPEYTRYYDFDFTSYLKPSQYSPLP